MDQRTIKFIGIGLIAVTLIAVVAGLALRRDHKPQIRTVAEMRELREGKSSSKSSGAKTPRDTGAPDGGRVFNVENGGTSPGTAEKTGANLDGMEPNATDGATSATVGSAAAAGTSGAEGGAAGTAVGADGKDGTAAAVKLGPDGKPISADGSSSGSASDGSASGEETDEEGDHNGVIVAGSVLRGEEPVPSAYLTLTADGGATVGSQTAEDGRYRFSPVAAGNYTLLLNSPSSPNSRRRMTLVEGQDRLSEDYIIPDLPAVKGEVVAQDSGDRVAKAEVQVLDGGNLIGRVFSGSDGAFELFPLEAGSYIAKAYADGYLPGERAFEVSTGSSNDSFIQIELPSATVVAGVVTDSNGIPVSGAYVSLFGSSVYNDPFGALGTKVTDGSGRFEFALPETAPTDAFRVGAYRKDLVPAYSPAYTADQVPDSVQVILTAGASFAGRVVDSDSNAVEHATVSVQTPYPTMGGIIQRFNTSPMVITPDSSGSFTVSAVEPGPITFTIAAEGYLTAEPEFQGVEGQTTNVGDIVLEDEGAKPGRIFGSIVDERGSPLSDQYVYVKGGSGTQTTRTDQSGAFQVDDLEDGDYSIYTNGSLLRGALFVSVDQTYPFARPGEDRIYIVYDMGQSVRFRALDASGQAIKSMKVRVDVQYLGVTGNLGEQEQAKLGYDWVFQTSTGEVTLENLIAGTAKIVISETGFGTKSVPDVTVPVGGGIDLGDIYVTDGADAEGQVVSSLDGSAISGMLVEALAPADAASDHPLRTSPATTNTNQDGTFRFRGLPIGTLDLRFSKAQWVTTRQTGFQVAASQGNPLGQFQIDPGATLKGVVTDSTGRLVNGALITVLGQTAYSDGEGRYSIDTLPDATGSLSVQAGNLRYGPVDFSIGLAEVRTMDIMLPSATN